MLNGQIRGKSRKESRTSHARAQARDFAKWSIRAQGEEPEAGDCDRPVRGSPLRGKGAAKEIVEAKVVEETELMRR
jgi:hypothetical protein